jgi:hypothetical protein
MDVSLRAALLNLALSSGVRTLDAAEALVERVVGEHG